MSERADFGTAEDGSIVEDYCAVCSPAMLRTLASSWWLLLVRGILAIAFGILALAQPLAAFVVFVILFGAWAFVDGLTMLVMSATVWKSWMMALAGVVGVGAGVITFINPAIAAIGLYAAIAGWSIARGVLEIAMAIRLRRRVKGEVWLVLGGIASLAFGALMIALPWSGILAVVWLVAAYALIYGGMMIALSLRMRHLRPWPSEPTTIHAPTPQAI